MSERCPTCSAYVRIVSTGEGTHHYQPLDREELWRIYLATGADPDGADPRHLNPGEALRAVEELREKCDLAYDAGHRDACNAAAEADRG